MPKTVRDFKNHCLNYFINAKGGVDNNLKVTCIFGCFENDFWSTIGSLYIMSA